MKKICCALTFAAIISVSAGPAIAQTSTTFPDRIPSSIQITMIGTAQQGDAKFLRTVESLLNHNQDISPSIADYAAHLRPDLSFQIKDLASHSEDYHYRTFEPFDYNKSLKRGLYPKHKPAERTAIRGVHNYNE